MKTYNTILVETKAPVGIITMNRPEKLNAMNLEMKNEIADALSDLETDDNVKVVILAGAGRAFSSGHDNDDPLENMLEFASLKEEHLLFTLEKPTIAAVHGYTLGDAMQQVATTSQDMLSSVQEASSTIDEINANVTQVHHMINEIAKSAQQQSTAIANTANNVEEISRKEQDNAKQTNEAHNDMSQLAELSQQLNQLVSRFKI